MQGIAKLIACWHVGCRDGAAALLMKSTFLRPTLSVRIHKTLRVTLAMETGVTEHVWSLEEVAALSN
ncbi:MAG: hypothetical protein EXR86_07545 [Gammaproteobacteria bacterium]|nr:hypothetical protein [Gammaproteobacteria bacterium]